MAARLDTTDVPPPIWLPSGHLQTLYPSLVAPGLNPIVYTRERVTTSDNDFIDIDWTALGVANSVEKMDPAHFVTPPRIGLIIYHGLEGSSQSHYARAIAQYFRARNWIVAIPHFRGCSGSPNRLPRSYHASDIQDIPTIHNFIQSRFPEVQWHAAGISLGGNVLLKHLGIQGESESILKSAAAISAPLDLAACGTRLDQGLHRTLYTRHFLKSLKKKVYEKSRYYPGFVDLPAISNATTLYEFDNYYTAPVHGFKNVLDYWEKSSSKRDLPNIKLPTLILNSKNDPFLPSNVLPTPQEASKDVLLHQPESGGHVGFVTGRFPGELNWLPKRLESFFTLQQ